MANTSAGTEAGTPAAAKIVLTAATAYQAEPLEISHLRLLVYIPVNLRGGFDSFSKDLDKITSA